MRVTTKAARQFVSVDSCVSEDLFDLVAATGEDPQTFFNGGVWENLNFSKFDMSKIEFLDAYVVGCTFRQGDISSQTKRNCRVFEGNTFVEQDEPSDASGHKSLGSQDVSGGIDIDDLVALVRVYNKKTDEELIRKAYHYSSQMHEGQFRHSGEPYFSHPVAVAAILAEQKLDDATIVAALLHDTIEDTRSTHSDLVNEFGTEVADLVDGVTKLTNLRLTAVDSKLTENFRKLFMAISKDVRVLMIKLADRLHNMRTISSMRPEKQAQKARETLEIFAPLAQRMGLQWLQEELEDLAFRILNPNARSAILRRFIKQQKVNGDIVGRISDEILGEMQKAGIDADVTGSARKPYSIWLSMEETGRGFERLSDVYTFLVITSSEEDCYRAQGAVHKRWRAIPGYFKDYISQPKSNGYRSIHTVISDRDGLRVEVQIRTRQMNEVAMRGLTENLAVRSGSGEGNPLAVDPVRWLSKISDDLDQIADENEILESVKLDLYADRVFCFTPRGDVLSLPRGSTPIDFAYGVHTRIGDCCVGAKIDGVRVPLWTRLKNGQEVEIVTAQGQAPQATWLDFVASRKAKASIRKALRREDRERFVKLGRELARAAFESIGKQASEKALKSAAKRLGLPSETDLLKELGEANLSSVEMIEALYPGVDQGQQNTIDAADAVIGLTPEQDFARAECCQPVPGERIVGIFDRKVVLVHAIDCFSLAKFEDKPEKWIDLAWQDGHHASVYGVQIELSVLRKANVFGRVCLLLSELGSNVGQIGLRDITQGSCTLMLNVEVCDVEHLDTLFAALEAEGDIASVRRVRD